MFDYCVVEGATTLIDIVYVLPEVSESVSSSWIYRQEYVPPLPFEWKPHGLTLDRHCFDAIQENDTA